MFLLGNQFCIEINCSFPSSFKPFDYLSRDNTVVINNDLLPFVFNSLIKMFDNIFILLIKLLSMTSFSTRF